MTVSATRGEIPKCLSASAKWPTNLEAAQGHARAECLRVRACEREREREGGQRGEG